LATTSTYLACEGSDFDIVKVIYTIFVKLTLLLILQGELYLYANKCLA